MNHLLRNKYFFSPLKYGHRLGQSQQIVNKDLMTWPLMSYRIVPSIIFTQMLKTSSFCGRNGGQRDNTVFCQLRPDYNWTSYHYRSTSQPVLVSSFSTTSLRSWSTQPRGKSGMFTRMWERLGFTGKMNYPKFRLRNSALRLYLSCVELVDHEKFFTEFHLPDTFNSWFRITELHIWLALVRLAQEDREGKFVRNFIVQFMWEDMDKRSKKLGEITSSVARRKNLVDLSNQFKAILLSYDEGALGDDVVLAGALWRNFFDMEISDLQHLETLVAYVRKQLQHLDKQDSDMVLGKGLVTFLPLHGDQEDTARTKAILRTIIKRV